MRIDNFISKQDREIMDRIDRDCEALHIIPPPKAFIMAEVFNPEGERTDLLIDRAHTWTRNAYNGLLYRYNAAGSIGAAYGAGASIMKQINGAETADGFTLSLGTIGQQIGGIVIGTGTTPFSFEDTKLAALIPHGNLAGQMAYQAGERTVPTYDAGTKKHTLGQTRIFNNNSGNTIVVTEAGLHFWSGAGYLMCRDILSVPKSVLNAGQLVMSYFFEMTFPA